MVTDESHTHNCVQESLLNVRSLQRSTEQHERLFSFTIRGALKTMRKLLGRAPSARETFLSLYGLLAFICCPRKVFKGEAPLLVCLCATLKVCFAQLDTNRPQMWKTREKRTGALKRGEGRMRPAGKTSQVRTSTTFGLWVLKPPPLPRWREVPGPVLTRRTERNTTPPQTSHTVPLKQVVKHVTER